MIFWDPKIDITTEDGRTRAGVDLDIPSGGAVILNLQQDGGFNVSFAVSIPEFVRAAKGLFPRAFSVEDHRAALVREGYIITPPRRSLSDRLGGMF